MAPYSFNIICINAAFIKGCGISFSIINSNQQLQITCNNNNNDITAVVHNNKNLPQ